MQSHTLFVPGIIHTISRKFTFSVNYYVHFEICRVIIFSANEWLTRIFEILITIVFGSLMAVWKFSDSMNLWDP